MKEKLVPLSDIPVGSYFIFNSIYPTYKESTYMKTDVNVSLTDDGASYVLNTSGDDTLSISASGKYLLLKRSVRVMTSTKDEFNLANNRNRYINKRIEYENSIVDQFAKIQSRLDSIEQKLNDDSFKSKIQPRQFKVDDCRIQKIKEETQFNQLPMGSFDQLPVGAKFTLEPNGDQYLKVFDVLSKTYRAINLTTNNVVHIHKRTLVFPSSVAKIN